ncbi:MAG: CoA transferase, partial [Gammaproteobacteria bacterium]|nr:CoA transferase [Gammaproteobacteria bacterium]
YDLLKGARVLDLTTIVLGPFATRYLGDFGADIIKVEPPSGDLFRYVRPARSDSMGAGYLNSNRNKRSVILDMKSPEGRQCLFSLLDGADVIVHNMRPKTAKQLGVDPESIRKVFPKIVYCCAAGYASGGRKAELPAYDDIIQAACGAADLNQNEQGEPRFLPTILCDKVGGLHLALAVLSGLIHQTNTGQGCYIEVPMYEGIASFLLSEHLDGETFVPAIGTTGYERIMSPYRKPYATKDGYLAVLPYSTKNWINLFKAIGRSDLAKAGWVRDPAQRSDRISELYNILEQAMQKHSTSTWLEMLRDLDIPCSPVQALSDLFEDKHLNEINFFDEVEHPTEGKIRSVRSPFWVEGVDEKPDHPAPPYTEQNINISWYKRRDR